MPPLKEKIALVTGASRRVGRGIAQGLGEAGATVYLTARTLKEEQGPTPFRGSLETTAQEVEDLGGKAIPIQCDHTDDWQVKAVFDRIDRESGQLDILVNNAWSGYERMLKAFHIEGTRVIETDQEDPAGVKSYTYSKDPFWRQPVAIWDHTFIVGVRSAYVASVFAAQRMINQNRGLIVNTSAVNGLGASPITYGGAHHTLDRMTRDMADQLKNHNANTAVVSLYPCGPVTEKENEPDAETPLFVGRAVVAMATDEQIMDKSGLILLTRNLAKEYGFTDVDGIQPDAHPEVKQIF